MGTWGRPDSCPNSGVRVIDATDPADPVVVATLAGADEFPETSADGVWVGALASASFTGDLAIVGVRLYDTSERNRRSDDFRGLVFYDVTDPAEPLVLGSLHSGEMTQGPNDVTAAVAEDGTLLVSATVMQSYLHTEEAAGDWRLVDGTDPADPIELAHWDFRGALDEGSEARASTDYHAHTTTFSSGAESIWIGIWDGGVAMLDLTDRASPTMAAHVPVADGEEGNAHSVVFDAATGLLIRNDEDLEWRDETPSAWGGQTLYDGSDLSAVTQVGTFATDRSDLSTGVPAAPGYFSAHEIVLVNDIAYVSWFSDGLRIVDVSEPGQPEEVAHFVPAPTADPQHHFLGQGRGSEFAMVWSVKVADGLLYLSDMNSGLWIVRVAAAATANTTSAS